MQINVSKSQLLNKLRVVGKMVKGKEVMYSTFYFKAENEVTLKIVGSDESGRIETTVDCQITELSDKPFLIDAVPLLNGLKELPDQPITIDVDNKKMVIKYMTGKFEMAVQDANIYPAIPEMNNPEKFVVPGSILLKGFSTVSQFAATDELRPVMTSVNISNNNNHIAFAASTGHILAVYEEDIKDTFDFNFNVPQRIAKIITGLIPADDTDIDVKVASSNAQFKIGEYTVTYRLIEGSYPNFRAVIPKDSIMKVNINCAELISAINRISVFSDNASSMISLDFSENLLSLEAKDDGYSRSAKETMMLGEVYKPFKIGFKSSFLADVLKTISIDAENSLISFLSPSHAATFRPEGSEKVTIILMPMQVQ